ncbi:MAG: glycosyltransferase family 4 protein [Bacteroidota bacterium]
MAKLLRITTVPISLNLLLKGQLKFFKKNGFKVYAASADGQEIKDIKEREQVTHFILPYTRIISPFADLRALLLTFKLIKKLNPDIVHTHTPKAGLLGMIAAKLANVPHRLHTVAGMPLMEAKGINRRILQFTEKFTYRMATAVYPNSYKLKNWIESHLKPKTAKIKVIGAGSSNGIDTSFYKRTASVLEQAQNIRKELGISDSSTVLVFVGRLVRDKGINELVQVFDRFSIETHLILVGEFEDQREPLEAMTKQKITDTENIYHVGFQPDIRSYLCAGDIFVFPSYREGFPNVVLQACAMELPCVVTDINGCNEIIKNEFNGLFVTPKDTLSLEEQLLRLIQDRQLIRELSKQARQVALKYDQQEYWNALLAEYRSILDV